MLDALISYLLFGAMVGILTLGFGSLLDIIRGHDGKTAKAEAPESPPDDDEG